MENPEKKTPQAAEKAKDVKSSGKKLVQARLPFKILPSSPFEDSKDSPPAVSSPTRKRKLSYSEHEEEAEVKENKDAVDEVVLLDDSDIDEPKTPVNKSSKSGGSTCKLKIKLPSSKKKRKAKSLLETKKAESDVDVAAEENPQKKAKIEKVDAPKKDPKEDDDLEQKAEQHATQTPKGKAKSTPKSSKQSSSKKGSQKAVDDSKNADTPKTTKGGKSPCKEGTSPSEDIEEVKEIESQSESKKQDQGNSPKKKGKKDSPQKQAKDSDVDKSSIVESKASEAPKTRKRGKSTSPKSEKTADSPEEVPDTKCEEEETVSKDEQPKGDSESNESKPDRMEVDDEVIVIADDKKSSKESPAEIKTPAEKRLRSSMDNPSKATPSNRKSITKDNAKPSTPNSLKKSEQRKQQMKEEREKKIQEEKLQKQKEREEKEAQRKKEKEEKELERKREREEKELERKREREEKEEQRKKEKEEKEQERKREREEKEEQRKKEKEKKIAEQEAKNEEKRKKDEEERKKKEEIENKKKKAAENFTKFFVKPKAGQEKKPIVKEPEKEGVDTSTLAFKPFQVRADMKLAPTVRRHLESPDKTKLESVIENESKAIDRDHLYLQLIKSGNHVAYKELRRIRDEEDDDCTIIEDELEGAGEKIEEAKKKWYRAKYFMFIENRRPPFYGTWRKSSNLIGPRTPFGKDSTFFDYEIDSDDEWEEEEPGESLHGSDDEKDKESEDDDYDIDNKWLVPHGHLSDEELGDEDMEDTSREAQKAKLKVLQQEFDQKMKKKTEKLKPRLIGVIWTDENGNKPVSCPDVIWESLSKRAMIFSEIPLFEEPKEEVEEVEEASVSSTPPPQRLDFNDELIKDLTRLVYHNNNSKQFMINEFIAYSCKKYEIEDVDNLGIRKNKVREKIDEFAEWGSIEDIGANKKKKKFLCWVVSPEHLEKYSLGDLETKNNWEYILEPKKLKSEKKLAAPTTPKPVKAITEDTTKNAGSGKKRVNILMSVPRGQSIPQQSKNALISNFLQKNKKESSAGGENMEEDDQEDDVILLDD